MALDKGLIGKTGESVTVKVTSEDVAAFAKALGDAHPDYAAGKAVPPTFPIALTGKSGAGLSLLASLNLDLMRVLHGEQEFEYFSPVVPGDEITLEPRIGDLYTKEGKRGPMDMIVLETTGTKKNGEKAFISRGVIVYLAPKIK